MAAYRRVDGFKSPADWLPVHRDQRRGQRSVTSIGELYIFTPSLTVQVADTVHCLLLGYCNGVK